MTLFSLLDDVQAEHYLRVASDLGYSVAAVIWVTELFRGAPAPMVASLYVAVATTEIPVAPSIS